ncbi:MAG: helix-turn-helix domain-containing protein [Flavisolibacter sp.]
MAVQSVLEGLNIPYKSIELGKVDLNEGLNAQQLQQLNAALQHYHLELMEDKKKIITERIKTLIVELLHGGNDAMQLKLSVYLANSLQYDYTYLSNIFSEVEGSTIERFYIVNRVERVKELLIYEGLTVTEIANQLNYCNVSHLCLQFKKVTGQTPSEFKKLSEAADFVWRKL